VELFSAEFFYALGTIILIDLVLAGDNAIVIALAARNLPPAHQKKAIIWGTVGAIFVRTLMTVAVVWLLKIPGLLFVGGAALIYIAIKLLVPEADDGSNVDHAANSFWGAMKTIVIADAVMGLDNVLGVAGAAQGNFLLVVLGLLISIPIVVWGSTLILKWVEKYPWIMYVGAAVLAVTSAKMMWAEPFIQSYLVNVQYLKWPFIIAITAFVVGMGFWFNRNKTAAS
jgi:YjbE family integral membrane protein